MAGGLKEVRERIKSVINTQQITKAMKMVSAAKLRRAQQNIQQVRPYADRLNRMLSNILSNLDGDASTSFGKSREVKNTLLVVMTSNRGLCGAFNANICKETAALIREKYAQQQRTGNLTVLLSSVARKLMDEFSTGKYDAIEVVYGRFKNAATTFPTVEQWLPVPKMESPAGTKQKKADYIFEPDQQQLLEHLVPSILQLSFHKCLLDTLASEHGSRMTAMDKATENAEELLKALRINYNKARQEAITKELGEIVGGAAALEG